MIKFNQRIVLRMSILIVFILAVEICFRPEITYSNPLNQKDVPGKLSSSQITTPFNPSDILVFTLPDFNNLEVPTKTHASVIGSTHQSNDGRLTNYFYESEYLSQMVKITHDAGWKYATTFSSDCGDDNLPKNANYACLDINGNKITYSMPTEKPRVCNSFHYQGFKDYMISLGKKVVDAGVDIICIDSWSFNYEMIWRNGDFSPNSLQGFREYLRSRYTAKQLNNLGISDLDTFDYSVFIKKYHKKEYQNNDRYAIPFFKDFADFQVITCKEFWSDFIHEVRAYANTTGRQIFFTTNAAEYDISSGQHNFVGLSALDVVDGFISEYEFGLHPYNKMLPEYKLLRGLGKPAALIPNCGTSAELLSRPDVAELMKRYIAEAYASGEFTYVPYANMINGPSGWQYYSADMKELYSYFDFIYNNKTYYDNLISTAKTVVLYSYPSIRRGMDTISSFYGISNMIVDANKQYDVVYSGDSDWVTDKLTLEKLKPYELLILPNVTNMSDKQVKLVLNYVKQGGSVLALGRIDTADEKNNPRQRSKLTALLKEGTHSYGKGRFVYVGEDLGTKYLKEKDSSSKKKMTDLMAKLSTDHIKIKNNNVVSTGYMDNEGAQVIHLINYDYNAKTQSFNQQNNLNIQVAINKELLGKQLEIRYNTPDENGVIEPKYSSDGKTLSIQLPNLKVYGVLYIGEKDSK